MTVLFNLATNLTVTPAAPLVAGVPTLLWESDIQSQGGTSPSVSLYVSYEAFNPDTEVVSPFNFELQAEVLQKQDDNSWEEIGRQNSGIRKLSQGKQRHIIISPDLTVEEEGVDQVMPGLNGVPAKLKSRFQDNAEGDLRVRMYVVDNDPQGANPFTSVTFSINGSRY